LPLSILGLPDIEDLASSVHEELALVSEDLPPSAGSTSDLQVSAATVTLDVERLPVLLAQDCSGLVVEVPNLVLTARAERVAASHLDCGLVAIYSSQVSTSW